MVLGEGGAADSRVCLYVGSRAVPGSRAKISCSDAHVEVCGCSCVAQIVCVMKVSMTLAFSYFSWGTSTTRQSSRLWELS